MSNRCRTGHKHAFIISLLARATRQDFAFGCVGITIKLFALLKILVDVCAWALDSLQLKKRDVRSIALPQLVLVRAESYAV